MDTPVRIQIDLHLVLKMELYYRTEFLLIEAMYQSGDMDIEMYNVTNVTMNKIKELFTIQIKTFYN